ncbi:MAG: LPS assembly protein LptD [Pseudomonadota bacterium]
MPPTLARLTLALSIFAVFARASLAEDRPLVLKRDTELLGSQAAGSEGPLFLSGERMQSVGANVIEVSGNVEARKAGQNFFADTLRYDHGKEEIEARGNIRLEQANLIVTGDTLKLRLDSHTGLLTDPRYRILPNETRRFAARGEAEKLEFLGENRFAARNATYTTCALGNEDWKLKVADLNIDQDEQIGTARNVLLEFKDVPLLYSPWADFPLNDARKSGFLAPTLGVTGKSGLDITLPYYFNLAPNYDATLYPRVLARRGMQLGGEFRYLMHDYLGSAALEYLHEDQNDGRTRWLAALNHKQDIGPRMQGQINFQRVSDNEYFRDLSNQIEVTSRSILPQDGLLSYDGDWWQAGLRVQQLQVLQDPGQPILQTPYYRLPQFTLNANRELSPRFQFGIEGEYSVFQHPNPNPLTQVKGGDRFTLYPSLKLPYRTSAFFVTPKVGYHYTHYSIDRPLAGMSEDPSRSLPIASLDGGLVFERDFSFRGGRYQQTLEPRAYYVYAPYRNQRMLPVFDTAPLDLSFAQIFTENQFIGGDRINDANQLTLALTSRFIEDGSELERLKLALGQRYYFTTQQVTMPGTPPRDSSSTDLLALVSGQISKAWSMDAGWQFDTDLAKTVKTTLSTSYRPVLGQTASIGYRFLDGSVEQVDTAMQWPITSRLYGLMRANYSIRDNNLVEGLAGLEYNGGCWVLRGVVQRIATAESDVSNAFFLQLELNGMGRLGASPMSALRQSIPGYAPTNEFLSE